MTYCDDSTTLTEFSTDDDKILILDGKQRLSYFESREINLNSGMIKPANPLIRFIKIIFFK